MTATELLESEDAQAFGELGNVLFASFGGVLALVILRLFTPQTLDLLTMVGFCVVLGYFLWGDTVFPSRHGGRFQ